MKSLETFLNGKNIDVIKSDGKVVNMDYNQFVTYLALEFLGVSYYTGTLKLIEYDRGEPN